ncbi:hypothetical protein GQ600_1366 [Phytophthora cactorum]|nr:hypothetical protein GQ600_1366 [Phytophthora cactorum]
MTLPLLENTIDIIRAARDGDMHDRTVEICSQFNGEPILFRSIGMPDEIVVSTLKHSKMSSKHSSATFLRGLSCAKT